MSFSAFAFAAVTSLSLSFFCSSVTCLSFVVPGVAPVEYVAGDVVPVAVGALHSLQEVLPYDYYTLPFLRPSTPVRRRASSLGEWLQGDWLQTSPYAGTMLKDVRCMLVEAADSPRWEQNGVEVRQHIDRLEAFINQGYRASLAVDNLDAWDSSDDGASMWPILRQCRRSIPAEQLWRNQRGYALGLHHDCLGKTLLYNHLQLRFEVQRVVGQTSTAEWPRFLVVGFTVAPFSVRHRDDGSDCSGSSLFDPASGVGGDPNALLSVDDVRNGDARLLWSYGVTWVERPDISWATRWDAYLLSSPTNSAASASVHWFSLVNGLLIVVLLGAVVMLVVKHTVLQCDASNRCVAVASASNETVTWQSLQADEILRPACNHLLLTALVGNGLQLVAAYALLLCCALLGLLSPGNRGGLLTCGIVSYLLCAPVGGCVVQGLLRQASDDHHVSQKALLMCCALLPGLIVSLFFLPANVIQRSCGASSALSWTLVGKGVAALSVVGALLSLGGAACASRKRSCCFDKPDGGCGSQATTSTLQQCRKKPCRWYLRMWFVVAVPPFVAFGVVFVEIAFVYSAMWRGMVYYVFGFLAAASLLWVIAVASVAVIVTYFSLLSECAQWRWRAFAAGSGFGLHVLLYSWYFVAARMHLASTASLALYGIYSTGLAVLYGIAGGAVGVTASWMFIKALYTTRCIRESAVELTTIVKVPDVQACPDKQVC